MKNLLYLFLLITLCSMSYFFVYKKPTTTFDKQKTAFAITNPEVLEKVVITDFDGRIAKLERQNKEDWSINNRYITRPDAMSMLFKTLEKVRTNYPVPKSAEENVMKMLKERPTKVELYDKNGLVKTIIMSGYTNDQKGTYMMLEGSDQAYVTHIPGFDGYLSRRFFTNIEEWRSREVFDYKPFDVRKIRMEYPNKPEMSFELTFTPSDKFEVTSLKTPPLQTDNPLHRIFATEFLNSFNNIHVEAFNNDFSLKDSILRETPICKINITDLDNKTKEMTIYPMFLTERSKKMFDNQGNPMKYDSDRYYAVLNEERDFAVIQNHVFGKLLRQYSDFYIK